MNNFQFSKSSFSAICFFGFLIFLSYGAASCHNSSTDNAKTDSVNAKDSGKPEESKSEAKDTEETKVFHISKADSTKAADSVQRTKNPIRDFN